MKKKVVNIRLFKDSDLKRVLEIERNSFPEPWSENIFKLISGKRSIDFLVAQYETEIIGYIISSIVIRLNRKFERVKTGYIMNLAVDEKYRNHGIGSMLLQSILKKFSGKVSKIFLEVRRSNLAAVRFYSKFNFKVAKMMKSYYKNEDAYQMIKDL